MPRRPSSRRRGCGRGEPRTTTVPRVMYSQAWSPTPSTTATSRRSCAPRIARPRPRHSRARRRSRRRGRCCPTARARRHRRAAARSRSGRRTSTCRRSRSPRRRDASSTPAVRNAPKLWPAEPSKRARTRPCGGPGPTPRAMRPPSRAPTARSAFVIAIARLDEPRLLDGRAPGRQEQHRRPGLPRAGPGAPT